LLQNSDQGLSVDLGDNTELYLIQSLELQA